MQKYIKIGALLICASVSAFGAQNQVSRYFNNSKGLLDNTNTVIIEDQYCTGIENVSLGTKGKLTKRDGSQQINAVAALSTGPVTGGKYHNAATGSDFFGIVVGTTVWRTGNTFSGSYTLVTGTVTLTSAGSNLAQATSINDVAVFCNESDKPFKLGATGNAVHLSTPLFSGAKTCSTYGAYLVIANTTESSVAYPSRVRWSDINTPDSFPALNYIDVEPNDGDKIVSIVTFEDSVYVFKKRSIHRMLITGLDGADAFIIRPVSRNIGAWAKNSVKVIPNLGIAFLAQNTLYILSDSGLTPIGEPIQTTLDSVTRSMWSNAVAEVYPKQFEYWLAVSTTSDSKNRLVLVYDYTQQSWTTYTGLDVNMLAQAETSSGDNVLFTGDYTGNQYKQDTTATQDTRAGVLSNIPFSYTTPPYTMGGPETTKNYKYLYLFFDVVNSSVTVEAAFDYATTYEYSREIGVGDIGAVYDTALYDTDTYTAGSSQVARIELNKSAKAMTLRFTESSTTGFSIIGWSIVYTQEDFRD